VSTNKISSIPTIKGPSYLGDDLTVEGSVYCSDTVYINGRIEGTIISDGEVLIGKTGSVQGTIESHTVVVGGEVHGNLTVHEQLEVLEGGRIHGNLYIPPGGIIIHEGAVLEGECHILQPKKSIPIS